MDITIWNLLAYIRKWRKWIFISVLASLFIAFAYTTLNKHYYSEIIIEYTNQSAKRGKAADGSELNVYEIISPNIIEKALADVGSELSPENVRSSMSITPIIPQKVLDLQKSRLDNGEEYDYFPTKYLIKYVDYFGGSKNFTQDLLDAIIKNYMIYYSERYINKESLTQINKDLDSVTNDYLEMAEIISTNTDKISQILKHRSLASADYRSPSTGMSFLDLLYRYQELSAIDIPSLFAYIFSNQVTRDRDVLIKKYTNKREQYYIAQKNGLAQAELTLDLMNEFAKANIEVANSYNIATDGKDSQYMNTTDLEIGQSLSKDKTTYDTMALDYIEYGISANTNLYGAEYSNTVINIFSGARQGTVYLIKATTVTTDKIEKLNKKWSDLFGITDITMRDYNSYISSQHISFITGVVVSETINPMLYLAIAFVLGIGFSTVCAIGYESIKHNWALNYKIANRKG